MSKGPEKEDIISHHRSKIEEIPLEISGEVPNEGMRELQQDQDVKREFIKIDLSFVKEDPEEKNLEISTGNQQFKSQLEKNYTTNLETDYPNDLENLFKENYLIFEKQKLFQQIFNDILEKTNQIKLEDLQKLYLDHLNEISNIESFKCLACDYQTINKANLKSHLWIIHKYQLEFEVFKCLTCPYKSKSLPLLKKHLLKHIEDSVSDNNLSDVDRANSPKFKAKRKKVVKQCDLCDFKTENQAQFDTHEKTHFSLTDNCKKYICYICDLKNFEKVGLQKHLLKQHSITISKLAKKTLKCDFCNYTTLDKECLKVHCVSHKDPKDIKWFSCPECEFRTKFKRNLHNHQLAIHKPHQVEKKFLCEVCSRSFSTRSQLTNHALTHKTLDEVSEIFQCDICGYKSKKKYNLKIHMVVHKSAIELKTFVCEICGFQTKRKWNYDCHLLTHKDVSEVQLHVCQVCGYTTKFKERLARHLKTSTHQGRGTKFRSCTANYYNCSVCDYTSLRKKSYFQHIQTHNNPELIAKQCVVCEICGFKTNDKRNLNQHTISHKSVDEVRMFKCSEPNCEFQTKYRASLYTHIKGHKGLPLQTTFYKCDLCGLQSRRKYDHNMHLITHKSPTEVQVFNCTICSYQTKFKAYLRAHLKKRHGIVSSTRGRAKNPILN